MNRFFASSMMNGPATSICHGSSRHPIGVRSGVGSIRTPPAVMSMLVKNKSAQELASNYWSSTENSANNAWNVNFSSGNTNNNNKYNNNVVRAVAALSDEEIVAWIQAYDECRSNKMTSPHCTFYRLRYYYDLPLLAAEVKLRTYTPTTSITFCVKRPKLREIFAANFRDRIVQHYITRRIEPLLEARFHTQGNVSFNCRKRFGTLRAVQTAQHYLDSCFASDGSSVGTPYVAKFDVASFFMSIDIGVLWELLESFIRANYHGSDLDTLLWLTRITIFHRPQLDCERRGDIGLWRRLPSSKSLFGSSDSVGMPIGNITSQLLANFYMSFFDDWAISYCTARGWHYLRFVDDFLIVAPIQSSAPSSSLPLGRQLSQFHREATRWLSDRLHLVLHQDKRYIQPAHHGVQFVGSYLKPRRTYLINRTYATLTDRLLFLNEQCCYHDGVYITRWRASPSYWRDLHFYPLPDRRVMHAVRGSRRRYSFLLILDHLVASVNALMGFCAHSRSYARRRAIIARSLDATAYRYVYWKRDYSVLKIRTSYTLTTYAQQQLSPY